jgi:hypothetical protein
MVGSNFWKSWRREGGRGTREKKERKIFKKPRERKDERNEIFCAQNQLNILWCVITKIPLT